MHSKNYDFLFKVVLFGDSCVGKSNLVSRFIYNELTSSHTTGIDFSTKAVAIDGKNVKAQIWDTIGQERFRRLSAAYCSGGHGAIIVYNISERRTFENIELFILPLIRGSAPEDMVLMLIGNKSDLHHKRQVSTEEGKIFADKHGLGFIETSALESTNVELAFQTILNDIYQKKKDTLLINPAVPAPLPPEKSCCVIV
jgi:Ras-related protein Rab-11A